MQFHAPRSAFLAVFALSLALVPSCGDAVHSGGGPIVTSDAAGDAVLAEDSGADSTAADDAATDAVSPADLAAADTAEGDAPAEDAATDAVETADAEVADVAESEVADAATDADDAQALPDVDETLDETDAAGTDAEADLEVAGTDATGTDVAETVDDAGEIAGSDAAAEVSGCVKAVECDDGDACTADECANSVCKNTAIANCNSAAIPCDTGVPCTSGVCNLKSHACVTCLKNSDCSGGLCVDFACVSATACTSDLACKASGQVCDKNSGFCVECLIGADCKPAQICSENKCIQPVTCKSSKDCAGVCDQGKGVCVDCVTDNDCNANQFCNSKSVCAADLCSQGVCGSGGLWFTCTGNGSGYEGGSGCDDGNLCTADSCPSGDTASGGSVTGCVHLPVDGTCVDGSVCTQGDACSGGKCAPGKSVDCNDENPCTIDSCNPVSGCAHDAGNAGGTCSDDNVCTFSDGCKDGKCVGVTGKCDDGNNCTDDSCDAITGCKFVGNTKPCSDGTACTEKEACSGGKCTGGVSVVCDDGNICSDNTCNPDTGCVFISNNVTCTDGNACTDVDTCNKGNCIAGKSCSDGNLCTLDVCDVKTGCTFTTSSCDDGDACTTDSCNTSTGACSHLQAPNCCTDGKVLYSRSFDDGSTTNFSVSNSTGSATKGWQIATNAKQSHTPKGSLWYGDSATGTYDFVDTFAQPITSSGTAAIGPIAIPSSLPSGATLVYSMWVWIETESCLTYDTFAVTATNGSKSANLWGKSSLTVDTSVTPTTDCPTHVTIPSGWHQISVPLPFNAGDFVTIKFAFDTVDNQYNDKGGFYADDLQILQACPK